MTSLKRRTLALPTVVALLLVAGIAPMGAVGAVETTVQELEGSGTAEDPYVITNGTQLQSMNDDLEAHYVLGSDVDVSDRAFTPIAKNERPFEGTLDGRGHTITGVTIPQDYDGTGFIGRSEGTIRNLHLADVDIDSHGDAGALVGINHGAIHNVSVEGSVTAEQRGAILGSAGAVGGLVGTNEPEGVVTGSWADVDVENPVGGIGGLIGVNNGLVENSVAMGSIQSDNGAGLIGLNEDTVRTSFATGEVSVSETKGGIVQENEGVISDGYWDVRTTGASKGVGEGARGGTGLDTSAMTGAAATRNLDGLDFGGRWVTTDGYPVLRWQVSELQLSTDEQILTVENGTDITVSLDTIGGRSLGATTVADLSVRDEAVASIENGTVEATATGETALTASHAGTRANVTVLVIASEGISAIDASAGTDEVTVGETVSVTGTFRNVDENGTFTHANLTANGDTVASANVTVAGEADGTHTFEWTPGEAGTYDLAIDGIDAGTVTVTAPPTETPGPTESDGDATPTDGAVGGSTPSPTDDTDGGGLPLVVLGVGALAIATAGVLAGRRL